MMTVTLTEWTPKTLHLEYEQALALEELHPRLDVRWDGPNTWTLRSNGLVGAVRLPGLDLVLRPHLPTGRVLWLVGYALKSPFIEADAMLTQDASLLEAFADMYLRSLRRTMRRGLQMGYRTVEEPLMTVRGRIRMADQARRHFGMVIPAEVRYDDYTADTETNRVLKAALSRLAVMPLQSVELRRRIATARAAFATVSDVRFDPCRLPEFAFNRLNEHYRFSLALAQIVLRSGSVDIHPGGTVVPGLLFDMWRVFQDFLYAAMRPHFSREQRWQSQVQIPLDEAGLISLRPDLSLLSGGCCIAVGDAKYKHTEHGEQADLYQLLAYCIATGLPSGTLVYAGGPVGGFTHQVRHDGPSLDVVGVDLAASHAEIDLMLCRIASRMAGEPLGLAAVPPA
jgi:5-methylcytosine-specific restriction enzyme subunit McrC